MSHDPLAPEAMISDEGRRMADAHQLARAVGGGGRWIACRLSDGGSDGVIYDTREEAVKHQLHERQCFYIKVQHHPMDAREATALIAAMRKIYESGKVDLSDPAAQRIVLPTADVERRDVFAQAIKNMIGIKTTGGL